MRRPVVASLLVLLALNAHAETFTVTRTDDPLPNGCIPGDCSLREAMAAAAANDPLGATDVVIVPAGTILLTRGELSVVAQRLRVQGAGSNLTRVVQTEDFTNVFHTAEGGDLAVVGMSLDSHRSPVSSCIIGFQGVPLVIEDVVFEGGTLDTCGTTTVRHSEIRTTLYCNNGQTLVEDSTIRDLVVQGGESSRLTLRRVLVDGALDPERPYTGRMHLIRGTLIAEDSTITHAEFFFQGFSGTLALRRVHYIDNIGPIRTEAEATVTIEDSLFENNTVRALYAAGGAQWTVTGSSFVNNRVDGNAGGAIVLEDDTRLTIRNSTFSGNNFTAAAGGDGARGAAIGYRNGDGAILSLNHVTIVPPLILSPGSVGSAIGGHGNNLNVRVHGSNNILRGTCAMDGGVLGNNNGNIESPSDTCGLNTTSNIVNVSGASLALGPLADNGGRTPTHLPGTGSTAIGNANQTNCQPADQRGYGRPGSNASCDVGALETDGDDTLFTDGFE